MEPKQVTSIIGVVLLILFFIYACRSKSMFNAEEFFDGPARELAVAIQTNKLEKAEQLAGDVDVNRIYRDNMTFIMWAIINHRPKGLEWVLQHRANPNYQDGNGMSPVAYAATIIDKDYLEILLQHGGDPNSMYDKQPAIIGAALVDEDLWPNVLLLLDKGANINAADRRGQTLAMTYAAVNDFERAVYLIDKGADVYRKDNVDGTLALIVQEANPNFDTENYKWQQIVKTKLENKGIKFPVPRPWEERQKQQSKNEEDE